MKKTITITLSILILLTLLLGCGAQAETGTLQFKANGEDFVRQGFLSKDGWKVSFDHIYVNLDQITAYQTDPPYDPHEGGDIEAQTQVSLAGNHLVDLAEGPADAPPIPVGEVSDAPAGHYNALSWRMIPAAEGPAAGYPLVIMGTAEKEGQIVDFTLQVDTEYLYQCGEFVGDERKGFLEKDGTTDMEMTFHFDHIFGDAETPLDDDLNVGAPGFEPFAALAQDGSLEMNMAQLQENLSPEDYQMLVDILPTLGHVGEGHCNSQ